MTILPPHALRAACRAIYETAATDFTLPPLLRDASVGAPPARRIVVSSGGRAVSLSVSLDPACASPDPGRAPHAPVRFEVSAHDEARDVALQLDPAEQFELIRAYLLGVNEPLSVEAPLGNEGWRLGLRLAERFNLPVQAEFRLENGASPGEVCAVLAQSLYERTDAFFASREIGIAVWASRLSQELFGDERPAAEAFWPEPQDEPANPEPLAATMVRRRSLSIYWRRAAMVALALASCGAIAASLVSHTNGSGGDRTPASVAPLIAPQQVTQNATPARIELASADVPAIRLASAALPPFAPAILTGDADLSRLAPSVAGGVAAMIATDKAPPSPPRRAEPPAHRQTAQRQAEGAPRRGADPLASIGKAVAKLKRAVQRAHLPRLKFAGRNSPYADGPR